MISSRLCPRPAAGESRTTAEGESAAGPSPSSRERGRCPAGARSRGGRGWAQKGRGGEGTGLEGAEVGARPSRGGDGGGRATPFAARGRRAMARRGTPQHVPPGTSSQARQSTAGRGWGGWVRWAGACGTRVCLSGVAKAVPSPYHPKSRVPRDPGPLPTARCARCAAARRSRVPGSRSRDPNFSGWEPSKCARRSKVGSRVAMRSGFAHCPLKPPRGAGA